MTVDRRTYLSAGDRTLGEEFKQRGTGVVFSGFIPNDAEITFDRQDGQRMPLSFSHRWTNINGFESIWLFHAALPGDVGIERQKIDVATYDETSAPSESVQLSRSRRFGFSPFIDEDVASDIVITTDTSDGALKTVLQGTIGKPLYWLGYQVTFTADATVAVAGDVSLTLAVGPDQSPVVHWFYLPVTGAAVGVGPITDGWRNFQKGVRIYPDSFAYLKAQLSAALTRGKCIVHAHIGYPI